MGATSLTEVRDGSGTQSTYATDDAGNRSNVTTTLQFAQSWQVTSLYHVTGQAEGGGWSARVENAAGFMIYGPYVYGVPVGQQVAAYRLLIDNNVANNAAVVLVDVWDATLGSQLAVRTITRQEWATAGHYEVFELPFTFASGSASHNLEFRIYYLGSSYVRVEKVGYR